MNEKTNLVSKPVGVDTALRKFPQETTKKNMLTLGLSVGVVLLGVLTGFLLSGGKTSSSGETPNSDSNVVANSKEAGAKDESTFATNAEGKLLEGGKKGEGTHYLERPGGESQNAYLTSTSLDLAPFVGKKVKVWGETISSLNAGWLIDVGKIRVIE